GIARRRARLNVESRVSSRGPPRRHGPDRMHLPRALLALPALGLAVAGCGGGGHPVAGPPPSAPNRIALTSPAFKAGGTIPKRYSCDGANVSPPLRWRRVPGDARELALLVEDP